MKTYKRADRVKHLIQQEISQILQMDVRDPRVQFVVYSIGHNDIEQFRRIFLQPEFQQTLEKHFVRYTIGSYTLWERQ